MFYADDKFFSISDGRFGPNQRNLGIWPHFIIGNRLQIVCLRQETTDIQIDSGFIFCQSVEFRVDPLVAFGDLPRPLEDKCLRRVKCAKIGIPAGIIAEANADIDPSIAKALPRFARCRMLPESQVNPLPTNLVHQWRAISIGSGRVRHCMNERSGFVHDFRGNVGDPISFVPPIIEGL